MTNQPAWKPPAYPTVAPYLVVSEAESCIQFLKTVFVAEELRRFLRKNGSIMHAELRIHDSMIMVGDPGENWPAYASHLSVFVPDAIETFAVAIELGATPVLEPFSHDEASDIRCAFKDPGGNTWWVTTQRSMSH